MQKMNDTPGLYLSSSPFSLPFWFECHMHRYRSSALFSVHTNVYTTCVP
jgi:hypothetical protein